MCSKNEAKPSFEHCSTALAHLNEPWFKYCQILDPGSLEETPQAYNLESFLYSDSSFFTSAAMAMAVPLSGPSHASCRDAQSGQPTSPETTPIPHPFPSPATWPATPTPPPSAGRDVDSPADTPRGKQKQKRPQPLGFAPVVVNTPLLDASGAVAGLDVKAGLSGMFFNTDTLASDSSPSQPPPASSKRPQHQHGRHHHHDKESLTCYRRNLWQVSGEVILDRVPTHVVVSADPKHDGAEPILELSASLTAESMDGNHVPIISIPCRNSRTAAQPRAKAAGTPHDILLDVSSSPHNPLSDDADGAGRGRGDRGLLGVPFEWKRLQFKHATANNGRRKGAQQHYVVKISVLARVAAASPSAREWVRVAEVRSRPIIVRGRSPRNFDGETRLGPTTARLQAGRARRLCPKGEIVGGVGGMGGMGGVGTGAPGMGGVDVATTSEGVDVAESGPLPAHHQPTPTTSPWDSSSPSSGPRTRPLAPRPRAGSENTIASSETHTQAYAWSSGGTDTRRSSGVQPSPPGEDSGLAPRYYAFPEAGGNWIMHPDSFYWTLSGQHHQDQHHQHHQQAGAGIEAFIPSTNAAMSSGSVLTGGWIFEKPGLS